jgi:hypothetical protein
MFVLARVLRRDPSWAIRGQVTRWAAVLALLAFVVAFMDVLEPVTFRLFVALLLGWVMYASARLAGLGVRTPGGALPRPRVGDSDQMP